MAFALAIAAHPALHARATKVPKAVVKRRKNSKA
jgi:hypothetical protein